MDRPTKNHPKPIYNSLVKTYADTVCLYAAYYLLALACGAPCLQQAFDGHAVRMRLCRGTCILYNSLFNLAYMVAL